MAHRYLAALLCAVAIAAAGCGSAAGDVKSTGNAEAASADAAVGEAATESGAAAGEAAEATEGGAQAASTAAAVEGGADAQGAYALSSTAGEVYESENGWSVRYDSELVSVSEVWDGTEFAYTGEESGTNRIVIGYHPNTSTDIVLAEKTEDYDGSWLERSEGYFAGRADIWAFHVDVIRNGWRSTLGYTAVEHNDGVLLVEKTGSVESDEERGMQIADTMAGILDSLEFTNHEPQTEYDYIPGRYVLQTETTAADGSKAEASAGAQEEYPAWITLGEDHTGNLGTAEEQNIVWYSRDGIIREDREGGRIRFFHLEGETLYLQQGDAWIEYHKNLGVGQDPGSAPADGLAADSRTAVSFRTFESDEGWRLYYDKNLFAVSEGGGATEFVYGDGSDPAGRLTVRYIEDESTEDVLEDIAEDYDSAQVTRSEGYLGASTEDWAFTLSVPAEKEGAGMRKVYTAAEHNEGVLLIERYVSGSETEASEAENAVAQIVSTFLFTDHDPQWEYNEIAGRYILNDRILAGNAADYPKAITLRRDHSGTISRQEDVPIVWHARDGILKETAAGGSTYMYEIEDDVLYLQMGTEKVQFIKEEE